MNHRSGPGTRHQHLAAPAARARPGRARGRPGGRTTPGRVRGHRGGRGVPAATFGDVHGPAPGGAWHGSWHAPPDSPAPPVPSARFSVSSVLLVRSVHGAVVMVRRRSKVRFRNGAPRRSSRFSEAYFHVWVCDSGVQAGAGLPPALRALRAWVVTLPAARLVRGHAGVAVVPGPGAAGRVRACFRRPLFRAPRCLWRRGGEHGEGSCGGGAGFSAGARRLRGAGFLPAGRRSGAARAERDAPCLSLCLSWHVEFPWYSESLAGSY